MQDYQPLLTLHFILWVSVNGTCATRGTPQFQRGRLSGLSHRQLTGAMYSGRSRKLGTLHALNPCLLYCPCVFPLGRCGVETVLGILRRGVITPEQRDRSSVGYFIAHILLVSLVAITKTTRLNHCNLDVLLLLAVVTLLPSYV